MSKPVGAEERNVWLQAALAMQRVIVEDDINTQAQAAAQFAGAHADALLDQYRKRNGSTP